jgi:hypothetical protein
MFSCFSNIETIILLVIQPTNLEEATKTVQKYSKWLLDGLLAEIDTSFFTTMSKPQTACHPMDNRGSFPRVKAAGV